MVVPVSTHGNRAVGRVVRKTVLGFGIFVVGGTILYVSLTHPYEALEAVALFACLVAYYMIGHVAYILMGKE